MDILMMTAGIAILASVPVMIVGTVIAVMRGAR